MTHFGDYMDGVPVKISEKYKRPPKIELPYSVNECPIRAQTVVDSVKYCTTFEKNVLLKLKELRSAKETKKNERRHRLQLLEEEKQKKLDAIAAAEAEEKLKQLNVSEVSYPSTEEITAISPEEKTDENCDNALTQSESAGLDEAAASKDINYGPYTTTPESQLNILQPIQLQSNYQQSNLLDDPDPLQELKMTAKITKLPQYKQNVESLTFKDFENDTSSPFDNVELKTINDMELLAQVLQSERGSTSSYPQQYISVPGQTYSAPNCASQAQIEGMTYLPSSYVEQPIQGPGIMYSTPQNYPLTNGYYVPTDNVCENTIPMENVNMYISNYQYYVPTNSYPNLESVDPTYYNNQLTSSTEATQVSNGSNYIPQPYYFQYSQIPVQYPSANTNYNAVSQDQNTEIQTNSSISQSTVKSRSRSVPDIVRELNEELASEKLRAKERSYNASPIPAPKIIPHSSSNVKKEVRRSRRKCEQLPNPYEKLSPKLQSMCQKIHGMGFPLDRVARVCTLMGDNDKKIIEGLLIMGELMDLGFTEDKVSAALAKHQFNRDKALDELVS